MNPNFLIIGAMKAGTTTLYRDLDLHPDIYLPEEKEPEVLTRHADRSRQAADYADLFKKAPAGKLRGEASTAYTKRPDNEGIAQRAFDLCGPSLKVIYLTRNPVDRTISHYKHAFSHGETNLSFDEALEYNPSLLHYSNYSWQIEPWQKLFGDNVSIYRFEDYITDRSKAIRHFISFLELDPNLLPDNTLIQSFNTSESRRSPPRGAIRNFLHSRFYQRTVKQIFPKQLRDSIREIALPKARKVEVKLTSDARKEVLTRIEAHKS